MRKLMVALAAGAVLGLGACGDDNGPGGDLDEQEQAALIQALGTEGMLAPFAAIPFGRVTYMMTAPFQLDAPGVAAETCAPFEFYPT